MNRLDTVIQNRGSAPLLGAAVHRYNPDFLEIVSLLGFHAVWIEMEHGLMGFSEAADLCRMASGMGLLTMLRIPSASRENALKAAECGPDIIDLPMANSPEQVAELVRHCRYPPLGERGFFTSSRSVKFGMKGFGKELHQHVNGELALVVQIETREAVENVEAICRVQGIDGIFLGLGDLSGSLGVPGETNHPCVQQAVEHVLAVAREHGKHILAPGSPGDTAVWASRGACITFCASDTACMIDGARRAFQTASQSIARALYPTDESEPARIPAPHVVAPPLGARTGVSHHAESTDGQTSGKSNGDSLGKEKTVAL